jgi:DinB superfamily
MTAELKLAAATLARASREFLETLEGVTDDRYVQRPGPQRWSLAENAEHTTVAIRGVERMLTTRILQQPFPPEQRRLEDLTISRFLNDRSRAVTAPEMVRPKGRWTSIGEMSLALTASTDGVVAWSNTTDADLRGFGSAHPLLGLLDGVQWVTFLALHTRRHGTQALEIRREIGA